MGYQLTRPDADQLKFTSSKTGEWVLEDYLQNAEYGNLTLAQLLGLLFNTDGSVKNFVAVNGLTAITNGGTGATTAAAARTALGITPGNIGAQPAGSYAAPGVNTDITSLASPALGSATATTQAAGDNTTKVATTAFVSSASLGLPVPFTATAAAGVLTITVTQDTPIAMQLLGTAYKATVPNGASIAIPALASLGVATGQSTRIILAYSQANNSLMVANLAGGWLFDETNSLTPTVISGSATFSGLIYSSAGTTPTPYKIIGFVDATWTSGTGWSAPTLRASVSAAMPLASMSSIGYGQTWVNSGAGITRSVGTTFFNTTGKPITVVISVSVNGGNTQMTGTPTVGGVVLPSSQLFGGTGIAGVGLLSTFIVPPGASYSYALANGALNAWSELR